jgi:hypothetical protein
MITNLNQGCFMHSSAVALFLNKIAKNNYETQTKKGLTTTRTNYGYFRHSLGQLDRLLNFLQMFYIYVHVTE